MRPALKQGLPLLWRDPGTLQIGVDPRRAVALAGLGMAAAVVTLLDGSRDTDEVVRTAQTYGISPEAASRVIGLLASAGVLNDFPASLHRLLPDYLRARLAPEFACASLAYGDGDGGARTIARRRAAFVRVYGAGRIGACIATFLAASGVARVCCRDTGLADYGDLAPAGLGIDDIAEPRAAGVARAIRRIAPEVRTADGPELLPDLAVLAAPVIPEEIDELMRAGVPHLAARADEAIGVVGPLVAPGRSACLRCVDLSKAARDPAWPVVLAQATAGPGVAVPRPGAKHGRAGDRPSGTPASSPDRARGIRGAGSPARTVPPGDDCLAGGGASPKACDTVLAAAAAALAAAQALAFIDQAGPQPPVTANGTLEMVLPDWQWRRRTWLPQAACTCGAVAHAARDGGVWRPPARAAHGAPADGEQN